MDFQVELVGKIGSMALIDKADGIIDYNLFARLSQELRPGYIWVSSGAAEIGRLDYIRRTGHELSGSEEDVKTDYAAQGQSILMENYRRFVDTRYSLRQVLVEHQHFNDPQKREHLRALLLRAAREDAIPIVNYNDAVSSEECRKLEIRSLEQKHRKVVECVDNDETAAQVALLVRARTLVILTSVDGIYHDPKDPATLIKEIRARDAEQLIARIEEHKKFCKGASRKGANGAGAKLEYVKDAAAQGTEVFIASARYRIADIRAGRAPSTRISLD